MYCLLKRLIYHDIPYCTVIAAALTYLHKLHSKPFLMLQ